MSDSPQTDDPLALTTLAWRLRETDPARAGALVDQAEALAAGHDALLVKRVRANSLASRAFACRLRGQYRRAINLAAEAVVLAELINYPEAISRACSVAGRVHVQLGEYAEALSVHMRQLGASEQIADLTHKAWALTYIGLVYDSAGLPEMALSYHDQALAVARTATDPDIEATCLTHLCWSNMHAGNYEQALAMGFVAIPLADQHSSQRLQLILRNDIGAVYTRMGDYEQALRFFFYVHDHLHEQDEPSMLIFAKRGIGVAYLRQGASERAEVYLREALEIADRVGHRREQYECHEELAQISRQRGDILHALEHYDQAGRIKDQVFRQEMTNKLGVLERAYRAEAARKEAEIYYLRNVALEQEIAERRRVQEALRLYSEQLEDQVAARTRDLHEAQEQLVRRERLAILGQLAGGVAHELRNPLGVISNAVYFLQMTLTKADERTHEYLQIIRTRVEDAEQIVAALLNIARTRPAEARHIPLGGLLPDMFGRFPAPPTVQVEQQIAPDLPSIYVDSHQITQVLGNLFTNAYQAMPEGGTLRIEARPLDDQVELMIGDTGVGMDAETLVRIFEPLFSTKIHGIGLGLTVARNLVEINRGSIRVESQVGQGSRFYLTLPTTAPQA